MSIDFNRPRPGWATPIVAGIVMLYLALPTIMRLPWFAIPAAFCAALAVVNIRLYGIRATHRGRLEGMLRKHFSDREEPPIGR